MTMLEDAISVHTPNSDMVEITPIFILLHYTSLSTEDTISRFTDVNSKVSSHFLISSEGSITAFKPDDSDKFYDAYHAGESRWHYAGQDYYDLNKISAGIELENPNGNLEDYSDKQYDALASVIAHLKKRFPILNLDHCILGHEHVAGFRGKVDPGRNFDYTKLATLLGLNKLSQTYRLRSMLDERILSNILKDCGDIYFKDKNFPLFNTNLENKTKERRSYTANYNPQQWKNFVFQYIDFIR